jgi:glycosyltransferase involved in cell wall biosynthesis
VRIVHVVPRGEQPSSGVLTVIASLSGALSSAGHRVELWRLHAWDAGRYEDVRARFEPAGVEAVDALVRVTTARLGGAARDLADARRVDVVHLHGGFNPSNTAIARRLRVPYVFSPHSAYDPVSLRRSRGRKLAYAALFERAMVRRAALVVGLTDAEVADVRGFASPRATETIPNGVAAPPGRVDRGAFRRELALDEGQRLAVFVGRLDVDRKGLDRIVDGVAAAPGWSAALVGPDFRDVERLRLRIAELGIADRVRLVGERRHLDAAACVASADVFVLASRWEGLPMALLEALSLGTPAVVSEAVDRTIGVVGAGAGWVAPAGDVGEALRRVGEAAPEELDRRRAAARALARRYDWASVAERYGDAYRRVAGAREPVAG